MISELVTPALRSARRTVRNTVSKIVLWIAAGIAGGIAVGFLTATAYLWLERSWSSPAAALIVAIFYLLLAVVLALSATYVGSSAVKGPSIAEQVRAALPAAASVGGVLGMLRGRRASRREDSLPLTERGRIAAEKQVRRLGPVQRIGAGLLAGYVIGKIVDRRLDR